MGEKTSDVIGVETVEKIIRSPLTEQLEQLRALFPSIFSEGKIHLEDLRILLGNVAEGRPEKYTFAWAGQHDAVRLLQIPGYGTLDPQMNESINFEQTNNVFIEGDNLEVLKLLSASYSARVKMIYIDPPYNTGNNFVYPDNFTDPLNSYLKRTGQIDSNGNLLTTHPETHGRYHSTWLSMMYPRLYLSRQLLRNDGVILVSIDDHEVHHLRLLMNNVFGEENFIAELVWEKTRKNDARLFSVGHEYILVYAQSLSTLKAQNTIWREEKPGAKQVMEQYRLLRAQYKDDERAIEKALRTWYQSLPDTHPAKKLSRYKNIDKYAARYGPWRDDNISWPGGDGPGYAVIHPVTHHPCALPEGGWRFSTAKAMERQIQLGLVVFREDHTQPPIRKTHLLPVPAELDDETIQEAPDDEESNDIDISGMQVMPTVFNRQSQVAVKHLRSLMGGKVFDNPKDHEVLGRLIKYCTSATSGDIVLDFFAGTCSTAEAVLWLNHEDKGNRRFLCVQLPEPTHQKSSARRAGYLNIADIGKERIRRVISTFQNKNARRLISQSEDLGFRVFKLSASNYKQWKSVEDGDIDAYMAQLALFTDPLVEEWKPLGVLWEVALKEGYSLSSTIQQLDNIEENILWEVTDTEKEQSFFLCLDDHIQSSTIEALSLTKEHLFVCLNKALNDTLIANLTLQCRLKKI